VSWWVVIAIAVGAYAAKAAGLLLGPRVRRLARAEAWFALLPVSMLAALVAVQTFTMEQRLVLDARAVGVGVGAIAAWRRAPFVVVVVLAAASAATVRAL
jgi:hypothetical protein